LRSSVKRFELGHSESLRFDVSVQTLDRDRAKREAGQHRQS